MKSTIEIIENGKPIKSNQMQTNSGFLSIINSCQQFVEPNFVKDFQQDPNLAVDHKNCSNFSFLHKLSHDHKQGNDDYFPQGEEYEEEIGIDDYQLGKKTPSKKPPRVDDEHDNFKPTMLMFEDNKCIKRDPLTTFITHVHFSNIELTKADQIMLTSKKVSNKDAVEKLQTLIEKVTELKRRVFRLKHEAPKTEVTTDGREEKKIANENKSNESTNRSCFISQRVSTPGY